MHIINTKDLEKRKVMCQPTKAKVKRFIIIVREDCHRGVDIFEPKQLHALTHFTLGTYFSQIQKDKMKKKWYWKRIILTLNA